MSNRSCIQKMHALLSVIFCFFEKFSTLIVSCGGFDFGSILFITYSGNVRNIAPNISLCFPIINI